MNQRTCLCCKELFTPRNNILNQQYCGKEACRRYRRAAWQRKKMLDDPTYLVNQKEAQQTWRSKRPDYMSTYRSTHPQYRETERQRCQKRRQYSSMEQSIVTGPLPAVKMDSLPVLPIKSGIYKIAPVVENDVKMDSYYVQLTVIKEERMHCGLLDAAP
jgi:hypothetical protein